MQFQKIVSASIPALFLAILLAPLTPADRATAAPIELAQADSTPMNINPGATPRARSAPEYGNSGSYQGGYQNGSNGYQSSDGYQSGGNAYQGGNTYQNGGSYQGNGTYGGANGGEPGQPYGPPPGEAGAQGDQRPKARKFSIDEITAAGNHFFGGVSRDLAKVIQYSFQHWGEPNGYILGEEAGGAFFAGVRYGEGTLYTRDAGDYKVYWQGPSVGYDFGAEGSKTMVLVYNLRSPEDIYQTFSGVDGSAYLIGGIGVTYMTKGDIALAPIRSGIGLRLGANIGYLKYTRRPTWNPF